MEVHNLVKERLKEKGIDINPRSVPQAENQVKYYYKYIIMICFKFIIDQIVGFKQYEENCPE